MILRIFATDGFTPERIFRWSVEETALHLCPQQVLWVTRLDGPWRPLVDWFLRQPCCRGVTLDPADLWEWNLEHEVTWRLAQGLCFVEGVLPDAVCWIHDDMAPPECQGFKEFVKRWLESESTAIEAPCYQLWNTFDLVRADEVGIDFAGDLHCWMAKWRPDLRWARPLGEAWQPGDAPDRFRPLAPRVLSTSPWPFRHAKGVDRDFREQKGFVRRGFPADRWKNADGVRCVPYNPEAVWKEFKESL